MTETTKLELEIAGIKTTWEKPIWDPTISDLIEAFTGLCVAQTFAKETVLRGMYNYLEEQGYFEDHETN